MAEKSEVILHGMWGSLYVKRVKLALELKGIPYEYVEEDLMNKSPQLLKLNPVYKKVPVLVHNGKPLAESLIIIEYIDENWKNGPRLLPEDPYRRTKVRFWANYIQHKVFDTMSMVLKTDGEEQEKAIKEVEENLQVLEEGMKEIFPDGTSTLKDNNMGLLDIVIYSLFSPYKALEEVIGMKFIVLENTPLVFSWIESAIELPIAKYLITPHEKLVAFFQFMRKNSR